MIYIGNNEYPIYLGDSEIPAIYCGEELIYPVNIGTLIGITIEDLTWVEDVPYSGGTATEENCSYKVVGHYDSGKSRTVTSKATVTGSLVVPATTAETREAVGTLELTATYEEFTASGSVGVYQEAYEIDYNKLYFTVEALENGSFYVRKASIDYSINGGSWQTTAGSTTISLSSGDKVRFRSTATRAGNNLFTGNTIAFNVYGNLMSLQNGDNFENQTAISLASGFSFCLSSCSNLKDASNLVLPATTLSSNCYRAFFYASTNLEVGPKILPATTLATYCYRSMYQNCNKIQVAPELPAPTLVQQCYYNMFGGCEKLNYVKCLATSISATDCRTDWMNQVQTTSGTFVKSPNITTSTWGKGRNGIPNNWTVIDNS